MRNMIDQYKSFVFDCDGVILDSNRIKTAAFRKAMIDEPADLVDVFIQYHKDNGGVSRYVKLQHYFTSIKKQEDYAESLDFLLQSFALIVREELIKVPMIAGVEKFLTLCQRNNIPCFVNSGGDEEELKDVFSERGIDIFFTQILGSPTTKKENLAKLQSENRLLQPAVFFGDAYSDYVAAAAYEIDFVYVSAVSEWDEGTNFCLQKNIPIINDFRSQ